MYNLIKSTQPYLRKYLNIHNSNLVYHTVANNMKADHLRKFNFLALHKF